MSKQAADRESAMVNGFSAYWSAPAHFDDCGIVKASIDCPYEETEFWFAFLYGMLAAYGYNGSYSD